MAPLQLPVLESGDGWTSWVHVQNLGHDDAGAVVFLWGGENPGACPPAADGPTATILLDPRGPGEMWIIDESEIARASARSALIFPVSEGSYTDACQGAAEVSSFDSWKEWRQDWEDGDYGTGELAAVVHRRGPGPSDGGPVEVNTEYVGIRDSWPPEGVSRQYTAPLSMVNYHRLYTDYWAQNGGVACADVTVGFYQQGYPDDNSSQEYGKVAPGERILVIPPSRLAEEDGGEWLGGAEISTRSPLGVVVDMKGRGMLLSRRATSAAEEGVVCHVPLVYRDMDFWNTGIQVRNTDDTLAAFMMVNILSPSGGDVVALGDWIPAHDNRTLYFPAIVGLPANFTGQAVVTSHQSISGYGRDPDGPPLSVVVNLQTVPDGQGMSYNPGIGLRTLPGRMALPVVFQGWQHLNSLIAVRNASNCVQLEMDILFYDASGLVGGIPDLKVEPESQRIIDLGQAGRFLKGGFKGAAVIDLYPGAILCEPHEEVYAVAAVLHRGGLDGYDAASGYEAVPSRYAVGCAVLEGGVYEDQISAPIEGAVVLSQDRGATTNHRGLYEIEGLWDGPHEVTAGATGYLTRTEGITLSCGTNHLDFDLRCADNAISGTVVVTATGVTEDIPVIGADLAITWTAPYDGAATGSSDTSGVTGEFALSGLPRGLPLSLSVTAEGYDPWGPTAIYTFTECAAAYTTTLELCAYGTIKGQITVGGDHGVGFTLSAIRGTEIVKRTTSSEAGKYALEGLPTGQSAGWYTYTVRAEKVGYAPMQTTKTFTGCGQIISGVDFAY